MRYLYFLLFIFLFSGCNNTNKGDEKTPTIETLPDTLAYVKEVIRKDEPNCIPTRERECAYFEAKYIQVTDGDTDYTIQSINEQLLALLRGKKYTNVIAHANGFIESYLQEKKDLRNAMPWVTTYNQSVLRNDASVFVVETNFYAFSGGAHGYYSTVYENYDRLSGKLIELSDLFEPGYEDRLNKVGEQYFRKALDMPYNQPLNELFSFDNNVFEIPDNFALIDQGIQFIFNPYDVASYAQGQQLFFVPYSALQTFVKAGSIATEIK